MFWVIGDMWRTNCGLVSFTDLETLGEAIVMRWVLNTWRHLEGQGGVDTVGKYPCNGEAVGCGSAEGLLDGIHARQCARDVG